MNPDKDIRLIKKLIIRAAEQNGDPMLVLEAIGRITAEYVDTDENLQLQRI